MSAPVPPVTLASSAVLAWCGHVERFAYERQGTGLDASPHLLASAARALVDAVRVDQGPQPRDDRQEAVRQWCFRAFGPGHSASVPQRGIRLAEEAIEAAQAAGCDRDMVHKLVDYVFDRPPGALAQELGGVGLTLLALAAAAGESADRCEQAELDRVLAKPLDHFAARNAAKNAAGFNVEPEPA